MSNTLNNEQQEAVTVNDRSLLIVAGAGTGKTRVLVEKIVWLLQSGVRGSNIIALAFTNKAADEMRERVRSQVVTRGIPFIGTFHSFCASLLRQFPEEAGVPAQFVIFDRDATRSVLRRCMKQQDIEGYTPRVIQNAISRLKTGFAAKDDSETMSVADGILPAYTKALREESALDFDDLIITAVSLLRKHDGVRGEMRSRYTHILVDEFQDIDALQNDLVSLLKHPDNHIIAVGDTDQTIYSWRGASVHTMLTFEKRYTPASVTFLTRNYRSTGNILAAANAVIEKNLLRQEKSLVPTRRSGELITCIQTDNEEGEAEQVAQTITRLHADGVAYRDIAVLFRANFQARALEHGMITHRIPYTVLGARFFDRVEIKNLIAYLTLIQNPRSQEAFTRAVKVPGGIGALTLKRVFAEEEHLVKPAMRTKLAAFRDDVAYITQVAEKHPVGHVLDTLVTTLSYTEYLKKTLEEPEKRMNNVRELIAFADRFSHLSGREGIAQLLAEVALSSDQDTLRTDTKNTVRLMTVHAAKGLEFPCVFITGMEEGLFPFAHGSEDAHDPEEERRLCYVAMTRAMNRLYCSFAEHRGIFGNHHIMRPSSFLSDIPDHLITEADGDESSSIEW